MPSPLFPFLPRDIIVGLFVLCVTSIMRQTKSVTTLTLTLIHPISNWTHWATLRRHPRLSRAATSASSQVNTIFRRSLLTTPSSSLLVDLVLSCILVPASTVLAVVCAVGPYGNPVQASEVVFLSVCCPWFVVQFWF